MRSGDQAKDFILPGIGGAPIGLFEKLSKASPLCLIFYKFNCPTCQFTFPHLGRVARALGPEHFLAVAQDSVKEASDFQKVHQFDFDIACDMKPYPVSRDYRVDFVPTLFIIEATKEISSIAEGFDKKAIEEIATRLADLKTLSPYQAFDPRDQVPLLKPG